MSAVGTIQAPRTALAHPAAAQLVRQWCADCDPATFPYRQVRAAFLRVGKHHAAPDLLAALAQARAEWHAAPSRGAPDGQLLTAFLDVALDKTDERYDYPSYIGLRLLPTGPREDLDRARAHRDRWLCWLMSDLLDFELAVRTPRPLPLLRPDAGVVGKRVHLGLRAMRPALARLGLGPLPTGTDPEQARQARELLAPTRTGDARLRVELSMLPVYTMHDEYLFLRVLQMFEVTFEYLSTSLNTATAAIATGDAARAEAALDSAARTLAESAPLFSLLATMQVAAFQTFRNFTEGASAIQSRGYKIMESLCRRPDPDRLDSAAYRSVPEVRAAVITGWPTVDAAYEDGGLDDAQRTRLRQAGARFEAQVLRWRRTHYSLAVRMLGRERSGTGYTEGTPYLAAVRDIPVFRRLTATVEPGTDPRGGRDG